MEISGGQILSQQQISGWCIKIEAVRKIFCFWEKIKKSEGLGRVGKL